MRIPTGKQIPMGKGFGGFGLPTKGKTMKKLKLPFDLRMDLIHAEGAYVIDPARIDAGYLPEYLCVEGLGEMWELPTPLPETLWFHVTDRVHEDASFVRPIQYRNWDEVGCLFNGVLFESAFGYLLFPQRTLAGLLEALCRVNEDYGLFVSLQYVEE